jgi:hypothetical protein
MSYRTTEELVGGIIELDNTISLDPFLLSANELVTEFCSAAGYTDARMELIERWLTAHFYCQLDPQTQSESVGGISQSYEGSTGFGLKRSRYGQMAMRMDSAGGLAKMDALLESGKKGLTPSLTWLGKTRAEKEAEAEIDE